MNDLFEDNGSISNLSLKVFNDIFSKVPMKTFKGGTVRYTDTGGYRFLQQNPRKSSYWGDLARDGHRILWVIELSTNKWIARVVDGKFSLL